MDEDIPNQSLHLTANSSAIFERLCPASKQVVFARFSVPQCCRLVVITEN